jgi:hypothetical protein
MKGVATGLFALARAASAGAAQRGDYGYEWPLQVRPEAGAQRLDLPPEVYAHVSDRGLRDLDAFNAAGEALPLGTIPEPAPAAVAPPPPARYTLPWYAVPAEPPAADAGDLHLRIERDPNGRLRRIDADVSTASAAATPASDLLFDASAVDVPIDAIELSWAQLAHANVTARFRVLASDDLDRWRTIVPEASVVDLNQNGFALLRRRIELPAARPKYLLLQRLDQGTPLVIEGATALLAVERGEAVRTKPATAVARFVAEDPKLHAYDYVAPGPLPSMQVSLELASPNSVSSVQILSRDRDDGYWQLRGAFTAFRVQSDGGEASNEPLAVGYSRDRQWRVVAQPPLDKPPALKLSYRPDTFVVLPRGAGPYVLVAGSAIARRADYPMQELIAALQRARHEPAALPLATLGDMRATRGEAALQAPPPPPPVRKWVLWGILIAGAAAVLFMVLQLVRQPPPAG